MGTERESLFAAVVLPTHHLCCACGTVSAESAWTYWQRNEEGDEWRPHIPFAEYDPMCKCPGCGWEHQDTDDGSGFYEGTLSEMEAQRAKDEPEHREWWADRLIESRMP